MLNVEGYKMFRGSALITPNPKSGRQPFREYGDWLFKPTYNTWYVNGKSFDSTIVSDIHDDYGE